MGAPRKPKKEPVRSYSMRSMPERLHKRIDRLKFVMNRTKEEVILSLVEDSLEKFEKFYKVLDHIPGPNPQGGVQGFTGAGAAVAQMEQPVIGGESFSQHRDGYPEELNKSLGVLMGAKKRRVAPQWIPDPMEDSGDYDFIEMYE